MGAWTKLLQNVNNRILKYLCKIQVDTPKSKSYSCSKFRKSPYIYIAAAIPYNIIKNSMSSFPHNSVSDGPNDFKFGTETCYMALQAHQNLRKLNIICKIICLMTAYGSDQQPIFDVVTEKQQPHCSIKTNNMCKTKVCFKTLDTKPRSPGAKYFFFKICCTSL